MPCDDAIIFGDLVGKLTVLQVRCSKCPRQDHYELSGLIMAHGPNTKIVDWLNAITADCPKKIARDVSDQRDAWCPYLPKVLQCPFLELSADSQ
jgi:hypothetical protein